MRAQERIEILHTDEKVVVFFNSLSRLSHFLANITNATGFNGGDTNGANNGSGGTTTSTNVTAEQGSLMGAIDRGAELYLKFSIWHGVKQMDCVVIKLDRLDRMLSKKVEFISKPHR